MEVLLLLIGHRLPAAVATLTVPGCPGARAPWLSKSAFVLKPGHCVPVGSPVVDDPLGGATAVKLGLPHGLKHLVVVH